ncbi:MAG: putative membrane protein [Halioglobus sp.]|jgi:uncharacterized membrane protein
MNRAAVRFSWHSAADKAHLLTWLAWAVLLLTQIIDAWLLHLPAIICFGKLVPLLIFLPGMVRENLRSYVWLCFVSLLYFISLVERLFAQPDSLLATAGMIAVVSLFISSMLFVRWRARELKSSPPG